jgi:hypothetical protein
VALSVGGSDFVDGAVVIWNGEARTTTFDSPTMLRISLTAEDLAAEGSIPVVVLNPEPAVAPSNTAVFGILRLEDEVFIDGFE